MTNLFSTFWRIVAILTTALAPSLSFADVPDTPAAPSAALELTRAKAADTLEYYERGEIQAARDAAMSAHIDGFEFIEPALSTLSPALLTEAEEALDDLAAAIDRRATVAELQSVKFRLEHELAEVEQLLAQPSLSGREAGAAAFLILLREGVEAVLVLAAIAAFLRKTDRLEAMPYVHGGWVIALGLGAVTWLAATHLIEISGADREMTEGITALLAAGMLLYVGFWLHSGVNSIRWRRFVGTRLEGAATSVRVWPFALVAFFAVYREVFETVLFTQTLWLQVTPQDRYFVVAGLILAAAALVLVSWAVFRLSIKLPLKPFFAANTALLVTLAVVFAGKGIMALQEAGLVPLQPVTFPQVPVLGIYPDLQSLLVQGLIVLTVLAFLGYSRWAPLRQQT